ncbi:MAG: hypothetical protein K6A32_00940 [Bacteroidales bacterium]|nr:hypothetical protein [Bacteroidales bacterium]
MAKRKNLKKAVNLVCENLLIELWAYGQMHKNIPPDDIENIAQSILMMQNDFVSRLSHVDKHQVNRFFQQLHDDLSVSTNEIIDHIFHLA